MTDNRAGHALSKYKNQDFLDAQIMDALDKSMFLRRDDSAGILEILDGYGTAHEIHQIFEAGKLINDTTEDACVIKRDKRGRLAGIKAGNIAKKLFGLRHARTDYHMHYDTHDYITVLLEAMMRYRIHSFTDFDPQLIEPNEQAARTINQLVSEVRRELRSEKVMQRMANRLKNARRNYRSALGYIDAMFDCYARLCVVRLDVAYKRLDDGGMVSLETANADIKALLGQIKKHTVFNHCVGHIGKLEFGEDKGYHFHLFFFFDGSKVQQDIIKCEQIGRLWQDTITSGQGIYHNCNTNKDKVYGDNCGIGQIHYSDADKRQKLKKAIRYITKSSQFLMAKLTRRSRLFFRGQSPKERAVVMGRPRAKQEGQAVIH